MPASAVTFSAESLNPLTIMVSVNSLPEYALLKFIISVNILQKFRPFTGLLTRYHVIISPASIFSDTQSA
jgi:hypothetical protein